MGKKNKLCVCVLTQHKIYISNILSSAIPEYFLSYPIKRIFCLKLKIAITTKPIGFSILGKLNIVKTVHGNVLRQFSVCSNYSGSKGGGNGSNIKFLRVSDFGYWLKGNVHEFSSF